MVHPQNVEIAFHEDTLVLTGNGILGEIDAVERLFLVVNLRLGRVLVFRAFLVVGEDAAAEADDASRQAVYGEHHAAVVAVIEAIVALDRQAYLLQKLFAIAVFLGVFGEGIPFGGVVTEVELLYDGVEVAALAEILETDGLAFVGVP